MADAIGDGLDGDVFARIRQIQDELSSGQKAIARFILQQYPVAAFLTAADLGDRVGISESTVVRFAMRLGYEGFPDLKRQIQEIVKNRMTTVDRVREAVDSAKTDTLPHRIIKADARNLAMLFKELSTDRFRRAVKAIVAGLNIYVIATRSALSVATFLSYNLGWIRPRVHLVSTEVGAGMVEKLVGIGDSDVAIAITIPRYTRVTVEALEYAKSKGCTTIAITDSDVSPLARHAQIALFAGTHIESFADSFVGPLSLANALLAAVSIESQDTSTHRLSELENLWATQRVYMDG